MREVAVSPAVSNDPVGQILGYSRKLSEFLCVSGVDIDQVRHEGLDVNHIGDVALWFRSPAALHSGNAALKMESKHCGARVPRSNNKMHSSTARTHQYGKIRTVLLTVIAIIVAVVVVGAILFRHYWPFTEDAVRRSLSSATSANVRLGNFRQTYFPPGCIAENASFERTNLAEPLMTVRKLTIRAYPSAMFRNRVSLIRAEGMHVILSANSQNADRASSRASRRTIDLLVADDAVLEIRHKDPKNDLRFVFHKFSMGDLGSNGPVSFSAVFENPKPKGLVRTSGQFGPWNSSKSDQTPVSGDYSLENADLGVFGGIGGILSSKGEFRGSFGQLAVEGSTKSPAFEVVKTHHSLPLDAQFTAEVDTFKGDVILKKIKAKYGDNDLQAQGTIGRTSAGKRAAILSLRCDRGRIEDVFYPFIHSPKSPLAGEVSFQMKVTIPSGHESFVKKLELRSNFQIHDALFTHEQTQKRLNKIAENPKQKNPSETLSDFQGSVRLTGGVAHFSSLSVHDQSAAAQFHGTYNLVDEHVNMQGNLKTATSLTKATHGISSVFAKVLEPFFKKKPHDTVVPVKISGTYSHPSFGLNM